ncbi:hypothetical protein PBS_44230 [Paraburkholderia sp. 2C]
MIAQMIIRVRNQKIEDDTRPQLLQVTIGLRAVGHQYPGDFKVARACRRIVAILVPGQPICLYLNPE